MKWRMRLVLVVVAVGTLMFTGQRAVLAQTTAVTTDQLAAATVTDSEVVGFQVLAENPGGVSAPVR